MSQKLGRFEFLFVERDRHGKWVVAFYRDDTRCVRPILDSEEKVIGPHRKPIGQELITTCEGIVGRKLTSKEASDIMSIRVVC